MGQDESGGRNFASVNKGLNGCTVHQNLDRIDLVQDGGWASARRDGVRRENERDTTQVERQFGSFRNADLSQDVEQSSGRFQRQHLIGLQSAIGPYVRPIVKQRNFPDGFAEYAGTLWSASQR